MSQRKLAIVTGASAGIGLEIAKLAAADGYDLIVAADTPLVDAARAVEVEGVEVENVEADLSSFEGVDRLLAAVNGREVDVLVANAGHGLGGAFLDQDATEWRHVIDTNVTGTIYLVQKIGLRRQLFRRARQRAQGYRRHRHLPQAGRDRDGFFERAELEDTKVGQAEKDDPADVAKMGWDAMKDGKRSVVHGWMNQLNVAGAKVLGGGFSAEQHRKMAEPCSAES